MLSPFSSFGWVVLVLSAFTFARVVPEGKVRVEIKGRLFYLMDFANLNNVQVEIYTV